MNYIQRLKYRWKHRGQADTQSVEGTSRNSSESRFFFERSYDHIEVVRRGVDMIVDSAIEIDVNITSSLPVKPVHEGGRQRQKTLLTILNFRPNKNEDVNSFRRELIIDYVLTGNCYQFWDGETNSYII